MSAHRRVHAGRGRLPARRATNFTARPCRWCGWSTIGFTLSGSPPTPSARYAVPAPPLRDDIRHDAQEYPLCAAVASGAPEAGRCAIPGPIAPAELSPGPHLRVEGLLGDGPRASRAERGLRGAVTSGTVRQAPADDPQARSGHPRVPGHASATGSRQERVLLPRRRNAPTRGAHRRSLAGRHRRLRRRRPGVRRSAPGATCGFSVPAPTCCGR